MKNVKLGFQLGLGFYLAKMVLCIPVAMQDPKVKRSWARLQDAIYDACEKEKPEVHEEPKPTTGAFPECKNTIGFISEERP